MTQGHPMPERLAEHAEGLLAWEDSQAVDDHLRGCAGCRETAAALETVSSRLAAAPRSLATPPDVTARVDRALAAEWSERARQLEAPSVGLLDRLRARLPALAAATAGVAVLGFAGWVVGTGSFGGGDDAADSEVAAEVPQEVQEDDGGEAAEPESAPRDDAGQGDGGSDESAAQLHTEDSEAAEDAPAADPDTSRVDEQALEAQIREVARRAEAGESRDGCGSRLADEQGTEVVGSATTDLAAPGSVLVVLDTADPGTVRGWILSSCEAGAGDALAPPFTVPLE